MNFENLLNSYRLLWSNRSLPAQIGAEHTLKEAIKVDLLDQMTHPRLRKRPEEKFLNALKRLLDSNLSSEHKIQLIQLHVEVLKSIQLK